MDIPNALPPYAVITMSRRKCAKRPPMTTDALELFLRYISAKWKATLTQIYPVLSQLAEFSEPEGVGER